jgi:hypothetical protein
MKDRKQKWYSDPLELAVKIRSTSYFLQLSVGYTMPKRSLRLRPDVHHVSWKLQLNLNCSNFSMENQIAS